MKTITETDYYEQVLTSPTPVLVDFSASWCQPCQQMAKTLESLENDYQGQVNFVKLDIDECQDVVTQLGIKSIPTLVMIKDGEPTGFVVGMQSRAKLDSILKDVVG